VTSFATKTKIYKKHAEKIAMRQTAIDFEYMETIGNAGHFN